LVQQQLLAFSNAKGIVPMTDFVVSSHHAAEARPVEWIRKLVWSMVLETLFLMAVGSATRVMNAGLACPDWPLCYGQLLPQQQLGNLQVFLEWFHRLMAFLMGLSAIALTLASFWNRRTLPQWLPWAALLSFGLIVFQGILGGLTVTQLLRFDIVTAHLGTALLFFVTVLSIGVCLLPYAGSGTGGRLPVVAFTAAVLVYVQSLLGALVGSQWAVHQCLSASQLCHVMNSHLVGVVPATLVTLLLSLWAWRTPALHPALRGLANAAVAIVFLQIALGVATFKLRLQVEPLTVAHQVMGATLLGILVAFTALSLRQGSSRSPRLPNPAPAIGQHSA
jgi:heme a synthase